ncbi:RNA polymerase sigma-70 factor [Compostimonas suwonensis]|uniref:RNA polymerase sigma-70 factor (ECF subfamily) n=1 Tax=Compostimonas suwonensis TaxID=1048394 RepID=A0A2M9C546_9MICO|nr:RNA polymerase sigma-70 factor [Compostimonas suwonensis]PJJ65653.1 RNA polymerase sigma-70 factor (ECF subfamily) [Compostimonas suwonensis]
MTTTTSEEGAARLHEFQAQRPRMFGIAYRMLGSATDADDVLQDAWLRWQGVDRSTVLDPAAYLARTVTNLCLNVLDSAHARREVYVGPWLPEPVVTRGTAEELPLGPLDDAAQRDTVSFALLQLLERLTPQERAAYVLHEAFDYGYREIAELIGTSEANARQLGARARQHIGSEREQRVDPGRWRELVGAFLAAARDGDIAALESLLADDVVTRSDGGGVVSAARKPVVGRDRVARFLAGVVERFAPNMAARFEEVNGEEAVVAMLGDELGGILFVEIRDGLIVTIDIVANPQKLAFAEAQLSGAEPSRPEPQ